MAFNERTHLSDSSEVKLMTKGSDSESCRPSLREEARPGEAVSQRRRLLNMITTLSV